MPTLKLHSNGLLQSNTVIGTLAVDGCYIWYTVQQEGDWAKLQRTQAPPRCAQM